MTNRSVLQDWVVELPFQQQSVLMSSLRGPDGMAKYHPAKKVIRAYRACVIRMATTGRAMMVDDEGDTFMDIRPLFETDWDEIADGYLHNVDNMPHHYHLHMMHSAQIVGVHHPSIIVSQAWRRFYLDCVEDMHLTAETKAGMNHRLNDFGSSPEGKNGYFPL